MAYHVSKTLYFKYLYVNVVSKVLNHQYIFYKNTKHTLGERRRIPTLHYPVLTIVFAIDNILINRKVIFESKKARLLKNILRFNSKP